MALTSTGKVLAWGQNTEGQLGDGTFTNSTVPVEVHLPAGVTVTAIDSGDDFVLALTSTGNVLAWGYNEWGQLGNGTTGVDSGVPVEVDLPQGTTATGISAGAGHALAVTSTGDVLAWGDNDFGQLGDGTTTDHNVPIETPIPADSGTVTQIAAGDDHSLALTATGKVLAWGYNAEGQLGDGTTTTRRLPVETHIPANVTVTSLAAGSGFQSFALTSTGAVLAWGDNTYGQLGDGTNTRRTQPVEVLLPEGTVVTALDSGDDHTVALTSTGRLLAWGDNTYGQLGDDTTTNSNVPVAVHLPEGTTAVAVGTGSYHSLAAAQGPSGTTTLTAAPTTTRPGEPVTLTATVTCTAGPPGGEVTFTDSNGAEIGTVAVNENGTATLTVSDLSEGTHTVTAHYSGDDRCPTSTSEPVTVTVEANHDGGHGNGSGNGNGDNGNGNGNVEGNGGDVNNNGGNNDNTVTGSGQNCSVTNSGTSLLTLASPSIVNCVNAPKNTSG
ncbi:alpha-tubulin suppressor-like RCC1 family protein [Streptomyces sp. CEV 2-1]|nr:alpha-tubulin suppressor-like RCC1 family protein [Streptomyces sp. CEV 2-1]